MLYPWVFFPVTRCSSSSEVDRPTNKKKTAWYYFTMQVQSLNSFDENTRPVLLTRHPSDVTSIPEGGVKKKQKRRGVTAGGKACNLARVSRGDMYEKNMYIRKEYLE